MNTPDFHTPPAPAPKPPNKALPLIILGIVMFFGCLTFVGLVGYGAYLGFQQGTRDLANRGSSTTGQTVQGWTVYSLEGAGFQIALPCPPSPDKTPLDSSFSSEVSRYATYRANTPDCWTIANMYEYNYPQADIEVGIRVTREWAQSWLGKDITSIKDDRLTVQGLNAARVYVEYMEDGRKCFADTLLLVEGNRSFSLTVGAVMPASGDRYELLQKLQDSFKLE
ncbi:MAG: hypothetical protein KF784_11775 [Fimbriimonadaceae bacterium]|nr:hypothetical protein [Fimbriimonadaceae bacterium]